MTGQSIYFQEEHDAFRAEVRRFIETEVAPKADEWESAGRLPREVFARMGELGFLGILAEERWGGAEADLFFAVALLEELPRSGMGGFAAAVGVQQFMATEHIRRFGSDELKERYLAPSIRGEKVGALGVTEPDTGSDVASLRTRAVRDGDDYVVDGAKTFITNGADGDFVTLAVRTDDKPGPGAVSLLVVDLDTPGVTVAQRLHKLGWWSSDTAELRFESVRVPHDRLIGEENRGFRYIMECFQLERLASAALSIGAADAAFDWITAYMNERKAFGRPLHRFQALVHRLADLATELEASRQLVYHATWRLEAGLDATRECSMAKLHATELAQRVADAGVQMLGGYGVMEEYPAARFFRDSRIGSIVAGTSEIMRELVGRTLFPG